MQYYPSEHPGSSALQLFSWAVDIQMLFSTPIILIFYVFPQSPQADADTIPQTAQQSLPFTYFKIYYSSVIPNFSLHN
jgi:hypothetical protein